MPEETAPIEDSKPAPGDTETTKVLKTPMPPAVALAFVIIALLGVLIVVSLRGNRAGGSGASEINDLQAEASALRTQLNRERVAMGLRPLEGGPEAIEDIAARLKKDADAMVALAGSFQSMLAEKDAEVSAKSAELIRSEQLRQSLSAEATRLQGELQRALVNGSDADILRREMASLKSQRDALAAELASVREQLATTGQSVSADDYADLERRLEETQRAKSFFESRVTELEGALSNAKLFAKSKTNSCRPPSSCSAACASLRARPTLKSRPPIPVSGPALARTSCTR
jgi:chromosome segregation ATPase